MKQTIGFLEYRSIAIGVDATDAMLKRGNVKLIDHYILCPGKYVAMIAGDIEGVKTAIDVGKRFDSDAYIDSVFIPNIHPSVIPAITGTTPTVIHNSLGIVEAMNIASCINAADAATKSGRVDLLEIRLSRGMGGKCFFSLCGELEAVKSAVKSAANLLKTDGSLIATSVIASPHKDLDI